jgi:hypothetical protein
MCLYGIDVQDVCDAHNTIKAATIAAQSCYQGAACILLHAYCFIHVADVHVRCAMMPAADTGA